MLVSALAAISGRTTEGLTFGRELVAACPPAADRAFTIPDQNLWHRTQPLDQRTPAREQIGMPGRDQQRHQPPRIPQNHRQHRELFRPSDLLKRRISAQSSTASIPSVLPSSDRARVTDQVVHFELRWAASQIAALCVRQGSVLSASQDARSSCWLSELQLAIEVVVSARLGWAGGVDPSWRAMAAKSNAAAPIA